LQAAAQTLEKLKSLGLDDLARKSLRIPEEYGLKAKASTREPNDDSDPENDPLAFLLDPKFEGPWIPNRQRPNWTRWDIPPDDPSVMMQSLTRSLPGGKTGVGGFGGSNDESAPRKLVEHQLGRVYVGDLPDTNVDHLRDFFNKVMVDGQGAGRRPGESIIQAFYNPLRRYAFLEVRDIDETIQLLELDGIYYKGNPIRLGRPPGFNHDLLERVRTGKHAPPPLKISVPREGKQYEYIKPDFGPTRLKVDNIPRDLEEKDLRQILEAFGPLQGLLYDNKNVSEGAFASCLCLYKDTTVNPLAIKGLNGLQVMEGKLQIREAMPGKDFPAIPLNSPVLAVPAIMNLNKIGDLPGRGVSGLMGLSGTRTRQMLMSGMVGAPVQSTLPEPDIKSPAVLANQAMEMPTRILVLLNLVTEKDLKDDDEYDDICDDIEGECGRYGKLRKIMIPRPTWNSTEGIGKVFVQYEELSSAILALTKIRGRRFGNQTVDGGFWPEEQFDQLKLDNLDKMYHINATDAVPLEPPYATEPNAQKNLNSTEAT